MDENAERVGEVDRLSNLPDSLIFQILLKLPTKDVVKTSVLSRQWKNLWKNVPGLELDRAHFPDCNTYVGFVDWFLGFNSESLIHKFKLEYNGYEEEAEIDHLMRWISTIVEGKKVLHFQVLDTWFEARIEMPPTIYTCESLVSLSLSELDLPSPEFITLPSLKVMHLISVTLANNLALETLISHCPVLESLSIKVSIPDLRQVLCVRAHSLLSFIYDEGSSAGVSIDAPRLEYLSIRDHGSDVFTLSNPAVLVKVDIDTQFGLDFEEYVDPDDLQKRNMVCNFLLGISSVKDMIITSSTLEVMYYYSTYDPLPLFRNLSFLRVKFFENQWGLLPFFLKSCPNLKSLAVGYESDPSSSRHRYILPGPRCLLASLEYVEIGRPSKGEEMEIELVGYLLETSPILKRLTLSLGDSKEREESVILRELIALPRLSSMCQVVVR